MFRSIALCFGFILTLAVSGTASFADIYEARNFYKFDEKTLSAGQPNENQLKSLSEDGVEVVINLVPENERIYNSEQASILKAQGIQYYHNPVNWGEPKASELESFLALMDIVGDRKVLVHCWANARASAFVYVHRALRAPETQKAELANLERVWREVAGYDLQSNTTWREFLSEQVENAE